MKKAYLILSLLAVSLIAGCGGPNYANGFKEWLAMDLAKRLPVKLAWVKIEKLSSGKTQAVFKFTSEIQFTENLYGPATPVDTAPATAALQKMKEANVPIPQQNEVIKIYNSITILSLFKVTTAEGKRIPMSGKAQATLQNNGEWQYELLDVVGGNYAGGKEPSGKWALEGRKEAKENAAEVQEKVGAVVAAADKAIQEARETQIREEKFAALVQKKEAEAAKAKEDEFFAFCGEGQVIYGKWMSNEGSGDVGIRWGQRTQVGNGYSITGVFFDPDNQKYQKPFDGIITKSDQKDSLYKFELHFLKGNGVRINASIWLSVIGAANRQLARDAGVTNKTVGLLLEPLRFNVNLAYRPNGDLIGAAEPAFEQVIYEPKFQFSKGYAPKKTAGEPSSSLIPNPAQTGSELVAAGAGQENTGSPLVTDQGRGEGGKYRMSREEIKTQVAASKPLVDAYAAAVQRMDNQARQRYLAELVAKYPQCPMTLFLQMGDAFMARDIAKGQKIYTILMTEYPDFEGMRAAYKSNYEGFMRIVSSGPK